MKVYILLLSVLRFCNSNSKEKEEEDEIDTPSFPIWKDCKYQVATRGKQPACIISCVMTAVGFTDIDGFINIAALKEYFENKLYDDFYDELEAETYLKHLEECAMGGNERDSTKFKELEKALQELWQNLNIPTGLGDLASIVFDAIASLFGSKEYDKLNLACRRANYFSSCMEANSQISKNTTG